jgi:hypothetical protein
MTDAAGAPGPLIGSGRAADVYALDDGRVLRRYRTAHSCAVGADLMRYLREAGYPVPRRWLGALTRSDKVHCLDADRRASAETWRSRRRHLAWSVPGMRR